VGRRDDGFTVVELVVAAAILFFAMTALVGLLGASTNMTASAKSRSALTNTIASELETIRMLRIEEVDYDTSGGQIPHTKVVTLENGVTLTLVYTITDRTAQNNTKEVLIRGTATRPGFAPVTFSSFAVIRDRIGGWCGASATVRIEFEDDSGGGSVLRVARNVHQHPHCRHA
jgi:Tfp pilus assembly protein PilV